MNGTPKSDGTCGECRHHWSGSAPNDGCAICDGDGTTHGTHMDGTYGLLAGPDCQYSKQDNCNVRGYVNASGACWCDTTYNGGSCQYSNAVDCSGKGQVDYNGNCPICFNYPSIADGMTKLYLGNKCQYSDNDTCKNGGVVDENGNCKWVLNNGDNIRIKHPDGRYFKGGVFACGTHWGMINDQYSKKYTCAFANGADKDSVFKFTGGLGNPVGGFLQLSNSSSSYNGSYVSASFWSGECGNFGTAGAHAATVMALQPNIGPPGSDFLIGKTSDGNGIQLILNDGSRNGLAEIKVCERGVPPFGNPSGAICSDCFHDDIYRGNGGNNGPSHVLAGISSSPLILSVEKQGLDGNFYAIDIPSLRPLPSATQAPYTDPPTRLAGGTDGDIIVDPADVAAGAVSVIHLSGKSDRRLKSNIVTLPNVLDKIDKIRGVSHDWIDPNKPEHELGVIAQEIQEVYPELVHTGDDGYLRVDYGKLSAVLLQAIKELKAEVRNR